MPNSFVELSLPYPPSVNTYWGFHGHRRFLTKKALEFKKLVANEVHSQPTRFGDQKLSVSLELYPPDRRVRDIDNPVKPLLDSLVQSGLFDDDKQIKVMHIYMKEPIKGGASKVQISTL